MFAWRLKTYSVGTRDYLFYNILLFYDNPLRCSSHLRTLSNNGMFNRNFLRSVVLLLAGQVHHISLNYIKKPHHDMRVLLESYNQTPKDSRRPITLDACLEPRKTLEPIRIDELSAYFARFGIYLRPFKIPLQQFLLYPMFHAQYIYRSVIKIWASGHTMTRSCTGHF